MIGLIKRLMNQAVSHLVTSGELEQLYRMGGFYRKGAISKRKERILSGQEIF